MVATTSVEHFRSFDRSRAKTHVVQPTLSAFSSSQVMGDTHSREEGMDQGKSLSFDPDRMYGVV